MVPDVSESRGRAVWAEIHPESTHSERVEKVPEIMAYKDRTEPFRAVGVVSQSGDVFATIGSGRRFQSSLHLRGDGAPTSRESR